MKKFVLAAVAAAVAVPAVAAPGDTATTQGVAVAQIVAPLTITHDSGARLDFGIIVPGSTAGTVTVDTTGAGSTSLDIAFVTGSNNSADSFTVEGEGGRMFSIATSGETIGGGMTFTTSVAADGTLSGSSGTTGTANVRVGGELTVPANQAAGTYNGSYTIEVQYL